MHTLHNLANVKPYTLSPRNNLFILDTPRNYHVRVQGGLRDSVTKAGKAAIERAYRALHAETRTLDWNRGPTVTRGDINGQFAVYHYCEDWIVGVRYDRKDGVWYASITRWFYRLEPNMGGDHTSLLCNFEIALIAE